MKVMIRTFQSTVGKGSPSVVIVLSVVLGLFVTLLYHASLLIEQKSDLERMMSLNREKLEKSTLDSTGASSEKLPEPIPYKFLSAQSASARLQSDISGILADSSALLISAQVLTDNDQTGQIELSVNAEASQMSLPPLLYKLETHKPTLFIKDINIRVRDGASTINDDPLMLNIVIIAFWKAD